MTGRDVEEVAASFDTPPDVVVSEAGDLAAAKIDAAPMVASKPDDLIRIAAALLLPSALVSQPPAV